MPTRSITKPSVRKLFIAASVLLVGLALATLAQAQPAVWPTKPVRIVVTFPPGGAPDTLARILADKWGQSLGQSITVDNKPGAGGTIGGLDVVRAAPDDLAKKVRSAARDESINGREVKVSAKSPLAQAQNQIDIQNIDRAFATNVKGMWLALREEATDTALAHAHATLFDTRPTAVNLRWALDRVRDALEAGTVWWDAWLDAAPEAPLAFVFSPLVGTPLTTSAKFAVVAKSPLTGLLTDALASSHFAIA